MSSGKEALELKCPACISALKWIRWHQASYCNLCASVYSFVKWVNGHIHSTWLFGANNKWPVAHCECWKDTGHCGCHAPSLRQSSQCLQNCTSSLFFPRPPRLPSSFPITPGCACPFLCTVLLTFLLLGSQAPAGAHLTAQNLNPAVPLLWDQQGSTEPAWPLF